MPTELQATTAEDEYRNLSIPASEFCRELSTQLAYLLSDAGVELGFPIQSRVKELDSVLEKIQASPSFVQTITELNDLIGLRIILLFPRDIFVVSKIVRRCFSVVREHDTRSKLQSNEFGYSSVKFVVKLRKEWAKLPAFVGKQDFKAEIQVRTLAQHLWAEVSHKLHYKRKQDVPKSIVRPLYRMSALLETVDFELERLLIQRDMYRRQAGAKALEEELNSDSLQEIIVEYLPPKNRRDHQCYDGLLEELRSLSITTKGHLLSFIARHVSKVLKLDKKYGRIAANKRATSETGKPLTAWSQTGLIRLMLKLERNEPIP